MSTHAKERFEGLLAACIELGASDMHLSSEQPVSYRVDGRLRPHGSEKYGARAIGAMAELIMSPRQREEYAERRTVDLGYSAAGGQRFRVNCFQELGQPAMAVRHLDQRILTLAELGLPEELRRLAYLQSGLVLVTGVTGSGKSTTLAVLLDEINRHRSCHILTVEDPVEFVHPHRKSLVHHREVHTDVPSFAEAVRAGLREDPDVMMIGEMRDQETMRTAMVAAETGHLVFSTLHTGTAVGAVERFIGAFPGEEQSVARHRFSLVLRAVVAQRLLPGSGGGCRVPAVELLQITPAAAHMIRAAKTEQLQSLVEAGAETGMWSMDQHLARLVGAKRVAREVAFRSCNDPELLRGLLDGPAKEGRRS